MDRKNIFNIRLLTMIAILLAVVVMSGCTQQTATPTVQANNTTTGITAANRTVVDMAGRTVTLPAQINTVIPLYGPAYEKLDILGAENLIPVAADFDKTNSAWAHVIYKRMDSLPVMSNPSAPNAEALLTYNPDVVFYFGNDQNVGAMTNAGIPVICSVGNTTTLDAQKTLLNMYAQVIGTPEALQRAQAYDTYFDQKMSYVTNVTSKIPDSQKPKVYVTSGIPLRTKGGNSTMSDTVAKAGGIDVAQGTPAGTVTVNYEQLLAWNPDIIIIDHAPDLPDPSTSATSNTSAADAVYDQIMNDPQMQSINAVKNHQVYISPQGAFFWDAGEQGILQLQWMAQIFHPDQFKTLDMKNELKSFYTEFFDYNLTDDQANLILEHKLPPGADKWGFK